MEQTLLALVDDLCENLQLWRPSIRLEANGFGLRPASQDLGTCTGNHGDPTTIDLRIAGAHPTGFRVS